MFRSVLILETEKMNTERSGQRIKNLFFILYIWKSAYSMLHCFVVQMKCACGIFYLIYFTVFLFSVSPLKFKGCTQWIGLNVFLLLLISEKRFGLFVLIKNWSHEWGMNFLDSSLFSKVCFWVKKKNLGELSRNVGESSVISTINCDLSGLKNLNPKYFLLNQNGYNCYWALFNS